jgi:hypothetical protein
MSYTVGTNPCRLLLDSILSSRRSSSFLLPFSPPHSLGSPHSLLPTSLPWRLRAQNPSSELHPPPPHRRATACSRFPTPPPCGGGAQSTSHGAPPQARPARAPPHHRRAAPRLALRRPALHVPQAAAPRPRGLRPQGRAPRDRRRPPATAAARGAFLIRVLMSREIPQLPAPGL